jgi:trimeric autotransporter adhesin
VKGVENLLRGERLFQGELPEKPQLFALSGFVPKRKRDRKITMRSIKAYSMRVLSGVLLCSTVLLCGRGLIAQNFTVAPRIAANVDESSLITLHGNVPGRTRTAYDLGEAPPAMRLTDIRLILSRTTAQEAALEQYLVELQDKSSPNYHKWLTPVKFGQLYGPADSDIAVLVAWLQSQGLTLETVSKGRTNIAFSGSVSQVEGAFHISIHSFSANGTQFYSNTADPNIPSALAPVVMGIAHLNTIRPNPQFIRGKSGRFNPETKRLEPLSPASGNQPRPSMTGGSGTSSDPYSLFIVPGDAATIYDTPNSLNANFSKGGSYNGTGVTIGIGGNAVIDPTVVGSGYRTLFLGNSTAPTVNYCISSNSCTSSTADAGFTGGDADEAYLDNELSGGLAPGASISYYASADLNTGIEAAIDANAVDIFSLSFGGCEATYSTSDNAQIDAWWQQAAAQGITVAVATGDSGSALCDTDTSPAAVGGLAVNAYASTPYNIAVGGTDFYSLINSFSTYVNTTSQGSPSTYYRTALDYIPESAWNESTATNTTISNNEPVSDPGHPDVIAGGGGGASSCSINTTVDVSNDHRVGSCLSGYSKPFWQTGAGVPADGARDLPDVSLMAGSGTDSAAWLVCSDDGLVTANNVVVTTNCETQSDGNFYFTSFGGTSTSTPAFAGILALVEQKTGGRLGQAAQTLYALYNSDPASQAFHDQNKVGNNSVTCVSGTPNCVVNSLGYYYESGYNTNATGYDQATGLGSVDATQLVNSWSSAASLAVPAVAIVPTPNPATSLQSFVASVSVTGSSGTPTGTVTLVGGGYNSTQTLGSGSCASTNCPFTVPAGSLATGTDTLTGNYSGDSNYAAATTSTTVTVTGRTTMVTVSAASSIRSIQALTVMGTVSGSSGTPTGTVTLTGGSYTSAPVTLIGGSYSLTIPANTFSAPGIVTLTVTYSGDSTYAAGAAGKATVQVTYVMTPILTVTAANSVDSSQTLNVTVAVLGSNISELSPTGTVTLTSGSYNSGAQALGIGSCTTNCAFIVPAGSLSLGANTLTAVYSGDLYYTSVQGTAPVTVTQSAFALQTTNIPTLASSGTAAATVTVSTYTAYAGTVTLACTLTSSPTGARNLPSCSFMKGSTVTLNSSTASGTAIATVGLASDTSELGSRKFPAKGSGWEGAGGGAVLAFVIFLGIPVRSRSWRSMLGILVMMAALGSLAACGGGSSKAGMTVGTYTFTVTGTGNPAVAPAPSPVTFTAIVN